MEESKDDGRVELVPQNSVSNMDFLLSLSEAKGAMGNRSENETKKREEVIDLILSDTNHSKSDLTRTKESSSKMDLNEFFLENVRTNDVGYGDDGASHQEDELSLKTSHNDPNERCKDSDDVDEIPTLDNLAVSNNEAAIFDFKMRVKQLPSLAQLVRKTKSYPVEFWLYTPIQKITLIFTNNRTQM